MNILCRGEPPLVGKRYSGSMGVQEHSERSSMRVDDDGISMHPLKLKLPQAGLYGAQRLRANVAILGGNDPNRFALGLKSENFISIENEVLLANAADDLPAPRRSHGVG